MLTQTASQIEAVFYSHKVLYDVVAPVNAKRQTGQAFPVLFKIFNKNRGNKKPYLNLFNPYVMLEYYYVLSFIIYGTRSMFCSRWK